MAKCGSIARWLPFQVCIPDDGSFQLSGHEGTKLDLWSPLPVLWILIQMKSLLNHFRIQIKVLIYSVFALTYEYSFEFSNIILLVKE